MPNKPFLERAAASLQHAWYQGSPWLVLLYPLSWLTAGVARWRLWRRRRQGRVPPVPVLVIGNITLGGTGKTPLVIAMCEALGQRGLRVGVVSRGYGARPPVLPWEVKGDQEADRAGDEPLLVARRTGVPVVIDPVRARALHYLLANHDVDVVISDDGLQHGGLPRTAEIVVLDGRRMLGNGRCLPAGPLREPRRRLGEVDWVVINGLAGDDATDEVVMTLEAGDPVNMVSGESIPMEEFVARFPLVHAIAGIGNPPRFFDALRAQGLHVREHPFTDHHRYSAGELDDLGDAAVLMTEKDAVKCRAFARPGFWYLPVDARLPTVFFDAVAERLRRSQQ